MREVLIDAWHWIAKAVIITVSTTGFSLAILRSPWRISKVLSGDLQLAAPVTIRDGREHEVETALRSQHPD